MCSVLLNIKQLEVISIMKYRYLPGTGLQVSEISIGSMTFGRQMNEEDSIEAVHYAYEQGVNFYDTANIYPPRDGKISEEILGKAVKPFRDHVILASKVGGPMSSDPNDHGASRRHILSAIDGSLSRLDTDYLDLYYLHFSDPSVPAEAFIETMNDLIHAGKILHYAVSNHSAWQMCELVHTAKEMNAIPPVATQSVYNLLTRGIEEEIVPFISKYKMGLMVFNPFAGGMLTGKYASHAMPEGARMTIDQGYKQRYYSERNLEIIDKLAGIAADLGISLAELSYQWILQKPYVTSIICGFTKLSQLKANLAADEGYEKLQIPVEEIDALWNELTGNRFTYHR